MTRSQWLGVALAAAGFLAWLGVAVMHPIAVGTPVDPAVTPADVKPEWYFLALYQLLRMVPERIGVFLPGAVGMVLVALPYLHPSAAGRDHRMVRALVALTLLGYAILTALGYAAVPGS